jgi:hypothetical protein
VTTFGATGGQNLASVLGSHSLPEAMLVSSFPVAWLKCPFHLLKTPLKWLFKITGRLMYHFTHR